MDPFVTMKIEIDVNDVGLLRYRVTLDLGYGADDPKGEGYSIEEAAKNAVTAAVKEATDG